MQTLAKQLDALSPLKRELLLKKLAEKRAGKPTSATKRDEIRPIDRNLPIPLSYSQRRLWFLDQFEPGTPAFNLVTLFRMVGPFNPEIMARALTALVKRHEVLRTTFRIQNDEPQQVIHAPFDVDLDVVDIEGDLESDQIIDAVMDEETNFAYDLTALPLFRVRVLRLQPDVHLFVLNIHHIISDGWSFGVMLGDLTTFYEAFSAEKIPSITPLPIQYADFAAWQNRRLDGASLDKLVGFWRQQLDDDFAPLQLPTDRPRPTIRTSNGNIEKFSFTPDLTKKLQALATAQNASLFMVTLAILQALLHRYTDRSHINIGSFIANRNRKEIEPLIGFFVNTLVLRADCGGEPTFAQFLQRVKQVTLDAYAHQDLPFEKLLEELKPERDLSHTPLFQVMLVMQNYPDTKEQVDGLKVMTVMPESEVHTHFDFTLWLFEADTHLEAKLEYNTDLFDARTMQRLLAHFVNFAEAVTASPNRPITQIDYLESSERTILLEHWNDNTTPLSDLAPHQLVEQQAQRHPHATAVVCGDRQLTYTELNEQANRLAHFLQAEGVGPEQKVAIMLPRSLDMIVAVLATLKAGAAYVALDTLYPPDRLALMVTDSQPHLLITTCDLAKTNQFSGLRQFLVDGHWPLIAQKFSAENPTSPTTPDNLAYVVYTSGSTGKPKGVMVTRRSLTNAFMGWQRDYDLHGGHRHLQMASFSFDVFAGDFVRALCSGGTLVLCPRDFLLDPEQLYELISAEKIDIGEFVPAVAKPLAQYVINQQQPLLNMHCLIVGSDTWYMADFANLQSAITPTTRLINSYGLSEATIDSTCFEGSEVELSADNPVPIGRAFANSQLYILDEHLHPVPVGVVGELYVGGAGLARGYHQLPRKTASNFIPHAYAVTDGQRLYKTGDTARYLSDGNIEFLGRNDRQIKIRGFRVELGEIQNVIESHAGINEALVVAQKNKNGVAQLVTYIIPNSNYQGDLRVYLRQQLPAHMLPTAIVPLEVMPLTPNGKVDQKALPLADLSVRQSDQTLVKPRSRTEFQLQSIWQTVLDVVPIGMTDNFFDLGGHSLLAVQLMTRIENRFGTRLQLATLFQHPTIEQLAERLEAKAENSLWSPLVPIQTKGANPPFFCVPGAGGTVLYLHELAAALGDNQPFYAFEARGLDGVLEPHDNVPEMAANYVAELQKVQPEGPYYLGGHSFGAFVAYEMAQQLIKAGHTVANVAIFNVAAPWIWLDQSHEPEQEKDDASWLWGAARTVQRWFGLEIEISEEALRILDSAEQLDYIVNQLREVNFLPYEADLSQIQGYINVFRANSEIAYMPTKIVPAPITLLRAEEQHEEDVKVPSTYENDPAWDWNRHASQPVQVTFSSGDHTTMMQTPHVNRLAQHLAQHLAAARQPDDLHQGIH